MTTNKKKDLNDFWLDLFKDPNNQATIEEIIKIGLVNEIILTPQAAIVIDELIQNQNENILLILPYLTKPSHEI